MYADDAVVDFLSDTVDCLHLVYMFHLYTTKWNIDVSTDTTELVVFTIRGKPPVKNHENLMLLSIYLTWDNTEF